MRSKLLDVVRDKPSTELIELPGREFLTAEPGGQAHREHLDPDTHLARAGSQMDRQRPAYTISALKQPEVQVTDEDAVRCSCSQPFDSARMSTDQVRGQASGSSR